MTVKQTNLKELNESLRAIVGLKPRKPGANHDPALGRLIRYAINTSANKNNGNVKLGEVALEIQGKIIQLQLVEAELEFLKSLPQHDGEKRLGVNPKPGKN